MSDPFKGFGQSRFLETSSNLEKCQQGQCGSTAGLLYLATDGVFGFPVTPGVSPIDELVREHVDGLPDVRDLFGKTCFRKLFPRGEGNETPLGREHGGERKEQRHSRSHPRLDW